MNSRLEINVTILTKAALVVIGFHVFTFRGIGLPAAGARVREAQPAR